MDTPSTTNAGSTSDPPDGGTAPFDWAVYADATFSGLAILIPIPLVDVFFEWVFWRRSPGAIARRHRRTLAPDTLKELNQSRWRLTGCLLFPFRLVLIFLKRLFRTLLYFLTIKEATDKLSHNWHRAFLIDHALRAGHLDHPTNGPLAARAITELLMEITTSPVHGLAAQVVGSARHVFSTVLRWFSKREENAAARQAHARIGRGWADLAVYFEGLARIYEEKLRIRSMPPSEGPAAG